MLKHQSDVRLLSGLSCQ